MSIYGSIALVDLSRFFSFLIYTQSVGHLGREISPPQGRYLDTEQHKHRINAKTSMPRTHDPSVRASEDGSCFRRRGHCDCSKCFGKHKNKKEPSDSCILRRLQEESDFWEQGHWLMFSSYDPQQKRHSTRMEILSAPCVFPTSLFHAQNKWYTSDKECPKTNYYSWQNVILILCRDEELLGQTFWTELQNLDVICILVIVLQRHDYPLIG
jgi:hypothetical protein